MLPEVVLSRLKEGAIPTSRTVKHVRLDDVVRLVKLRSSRLVNNVDDARRLVKHVLSSKPVVISSHSVLGPVGSVGDVYIMKYNTDFTFNVVTESKVRRPTIARLYSKVSTSGGDEVSKVVHVLYFSYGRYELPITVRVSKPCYVSCYSSLSSEYLIEYDRVSKTYACGVLDDRYKPGSEYPVQGADNVRLDIRYDFRVGNFVYPTPLPSGLSISNMSLDYVSGFIRYEDKIYKFPGVSNVVRISATVVNNTGDTINIYHWGLPVSVLYDDGMHVSQVNVPVRFGGISLPNGSSIRYSVDVDISSAWIYGMVNIAHALGIYKSGMPIYFGGPMYQFEVFRLLLP